MTDYESFIRAKGAYYKTDEELKAAYDRAWKASHDIMLTEAEYLDEVKPCCASEENKKAVYARLAAFVAEGKLKAAEVYRYGSHCWCVDHPEALIAYEVSKGKWAVNDCGEAISEEEAIIEVNREFGFEASRIRIIGVPYYDATDYQFIRFNVCGRAWLWQNEALMPIYE